MSSFTNSKQAVKSNVQASKQSRLTQQPIQQFPDISPQLQTILQRIVNDVVARLGCAGAMIATLEQGKALPVRAYAVDMPPEYLHQFEEAAGVSMMGADSVVYLDNKKHRKNLSVQIANGANGPQKYLVSDQLYDLFRPIVNKSVSDMVQQGLGVQQVVGVPFMLDNEVVGNLFAITREPVTQRDIDFLTAFGHQAATAIQGQQHLTAMEAIQRVVLALQSKMTDETEALQTIVNEVVNEMGYAGAIVATLENGNALPVRAYAVAAAPNLVQQLEDNVGVSLKGPKAVVYLDDDRYKDNLSVRAVKGINGSPEKYLITSKLYDLLRPIAMKPLANLAQRLIGIKQLIAVPFFLENKIVGNLFVATRKPSFSEQEIKVLIAFGHQAAIGLHNARLYREAQEQRLISQRFGRMAFSATASVHILRNQISAVRTYFHLLQMLPHLPPERHGQILKELPLLEDRLSAVTNILDNLHEPWHHIPDHPVDVNASVERALREVFPGIPLDQEQNAITIMGITVHLSLIHDLPKILTSADMLTEVFRVMIKNAAEAILETEQECNLWVSSRTVSETSVEVCIRDSGVGIKPENLSKIFEIGWSTKKGKGMGFGLFWARDFINGLGGSISIDSALGEGTTFHIRLPATNGR